MRYALLVAALLRACDLIQNGRHLGLEIIKKQRKLNIFHDGHIEYDITKHFAAFFLKGLKHVFFLQKWFENVILMTS